MLTKQEQINYWVRTGNDSWQSAEFLLSGKRNVDALFMFCLSIEKWLKANWIKDNVNNQPPRIHNLQALYSETDLNLNAELTDFLDTVNRWNIEGRYPDYKFSLHKLATDDYVAKQYDKLKILKECLLQNL